MKYVILYLHISLIFLVDVNTDFIAADIQVQKELTYKWIKKEPLNEDIADRFAILKPMTIDLRCKK